MAVDRPARHLGRGLAIAVVSVLAMAPAAASAAVTSQTVNGTASSDTQSRTIFGGASLQFGWDASWTPPSPPSPQPNGARIHFDNDFAFDTTGLTACSPALLAGTTTAAAILACPGAQVGTGNATLGGAVTCSGVVTAFNGVPSGSDPTLVLHVRFGAPCNTTAVSTGTLSASSLGGDFGTQADFTMGVSPGVALNHLSVTLANQEPAPGHHYVSARCNDVDQTWNYAGQFSFTDASTLSAAATQACTTGPNPAAPTVSGTSPASGADDNDPEVFGSAPAGSTVKIYDNAGCTGAELASGSDTDFAAPGITVSVADNTTTSFYATATDANSTSACSSTFATYDEVSPPAVPTVTGTSPASAGNDTNPRVFGTAAAGSTVKIYANSSCAGPELASGSAAEFFSTGIAATVVPESTTTFYANATNGAGTSACSTSFATYQHVTFNASDGSLDPTFDADGKAAFNFGQSTISLDERVTDAALQADGKLVVAGSQGETGPSGAVLVRVNGDGSLDTSFGGDGSVALDLGTGSTVQAVEIQGDGKIVVAGSSFDTGFSGQDGVVARVNANGSLDTSFSGDGMAKVDMGGFEQFSDLALAADGDPVASGVSGGMGPPTVLIARFDSVNGSPDSGFGGGDGLVTTTAVSASSSNPIAVQGTEILVAGVSGVARFEADGDLDTGFGSGGVATANFGPGASSQGPGAHSLAVLATGEVVLGSTVSVSGNQDFGVARFTAGGAADSSFAGDGTTTTSVGASDSVGAIAIQANGAIVAAGSTGSSSFSSDNQFALARFDGNGGLDAGFDGDGKLITDFGDNAQAVAATIDPGALAGDASDDHVIAAGTVGKVNQGESGDIALARYVGSDGSLDSAFDGDGKATIGQQITRDSNEGSEATVVQPDGKTVLAGVTDFPDGKANFLLARVNPDGSLDTSFGGDGFVLIDFGGRDAAYGLEIQDDGKLVAVGATTDLALPGGHLDWAIARVEPDGDLDSSFDGDGKRTLDAQSSGDEVADEVAIQPDGKIVVGGVGGDPASPPRFAMTAARFNQNGSLDTGFSGDGIAYAGAGLGTFGAFGTSMAVSPTDGKIVVGGAVTSSESEMAVARFDDADGSVDTSFSGDGVASADVGGPGFSDFLFGVTVQADGDVIGVGGTAPAGGPSGDGDTAAVRFNGSDGSLDAGFGTGGGFTTDLGPFDSAQAVAVQPDGKIVSIGYSQNGMEAIRLTSAGALDSSFGGDGAVTTAGVTGTDLGFEIGGDIYVGGSATTGDFASDMSLVRFGVGGDADADGIADDVDTVPGTPSDSFADGDGTSGSITDRAGLDVTIEDADAPDGVLVTVGAGSGQATFDACGFTETVDAGSSAILTCASVILEVLQGQAQVLLPPDSFVTIPAGSKAEVTDNGDGTFTVENQGSGDVTVTENGEETTLGPGESTTVNDDEDSDGVPDDEDNCPSVANPDQADADHDGLGSACDPVELPTSKDQCKSNGWRAFHNGTAQFKNQGECMSFVAGGKDPPQG